MSRIRRLSFRGIRNFGDENEEETLIRFQRPLTLILGPNGTGKTTIIEALKFITTGDYPPNSNNGKSFIYDPILTKTASVRCGIKAELIDSAGEIYAVHRIVESVKINRTLKLKALDSTFTRVKDKVSISSRCADINLEVLNTMGVSKALLNYVIFCHQEELNWPFEEGAQLKKKFDDIFETTMYNKALEDIRKQIKTQADELKILKTELNYQGEILQEVTNKKEKLISQQQRLQDVKGKMAIIDEQLQPLARRIEDSKKADEIYKKKLSEQEGKQVEYNLCIQQMKDLRENMQEILEVPIEELNNQITLYENVFEEKQKEIVELEKKLMQAAKEESKIEKLLAEERMTVGSLKQQLEYQQKRTNLRNKSLQTVSSMWKLEIASDDISEIEVFSIITQVDKKIQTLQNDVDKIRQEIDEEERNYQKEVDASRAEKSRIESEKNVKEKDVAKVQAELAHIRKSITNAGAAAKRLNAIEAEYKSACNDVEILQNAVDVDDGKNEIQKRINSRNKMEDELNKLDEEIAVLHKQNALKAELDLHRSALHAKEKQIQVLKTKHEKNLKSLLDVEELPQGKLKEKLESVQEKLTSEIKSLTSKCQSQQESLSSFLITQKCEEKELSKLKSELESGKEKVSSVCDYEMFDELLVLQAKKVKELQDARGMYAYQNKIYKDQLEQLKKKPCCPLCQQDFHDSSKLKNLITKMTKDMQDHPNRLKKSEEEMLAQQQKYDLMLQLTSVMEKVRDLENIQIVNLNESLKKTERRVKSIESTIEKLKSSLTEPEYKEKKCKEIMNDVSLWDQYFSEAQKCKRHIQDIKNRFDDEGGDSKRTIEDAQTERERLRAAIKTVREFIESSQSKLNAHLEKLQRARDKSNNLHEEQLKIRSEMQKLKQYQDKETELCAREVSLATSIKDLKQKLSTATETLNTAIKKLEQIKRYNAAKLEAKRKHLEEGSNSLSELRKIQKEVDSFIQKNISHELLQSEEQIEDYLTTIKAFAHEKKNLQNAISDVKEDISRQELVKRNLTDNVTLVKLQEKAENLKLQYKELKTALNAMNHNETLKNLRELQEEQQKLLQKKNIAKGNEEELKRSVNHYEVELEREENKTAENKYYHKLRKKTVTEEIIQDLKVYSKAVDVATIRYHEERMNTVNSIMKKLWEIVYKGNDTSYIALQAQATEGIGTARRTYNYKLVQKKHGVEMDMRGRCSAGQKVLASIIIRLALAETFCSNCSILALDEPTTSLDEHNANSLADALASIINHRYQLNKNFQLILITHDEKFMTKLANLSDTRTFYELYRKHNGRTGIRWHELGGETLPVSLKTENSSASEDEDQQDSGVATQPLSAQQKAQASRKKRCNENDDDDDQDEPSQSNPPKKRFVCKI